MSRPVRFIQFAVILACAVLALILIQPEALKTPAASATAPGSGIEVYHIADNGRGWNRTSMTTDSVTPGANRLVLLRVLAFDDSPPPAPSISGLNSTWSSVTTASAATSNRDGRLFLFSITTGASSPSGSIEIDFETAIYSMEWAIDVVDGVDTSDPIVQSEPRGVTGGSSLDVPLSSFSSDRNGTLGLFGNFAVGPILGSPEGSYTSLPSDEFHPSGPHTIPTTLGGGWLPAPDTTVSFTWNDQVEATVGIALEVRAAVYDPDTAAENVAMTEDPVNTITGDFNHTHTDLLVPTVGLPLEFTRYYHSGSAMQRYLSPGWTHTYDRYLVFNGDDVTVFYPDGHSVIFEDVSGVLTPRAGIYDTLEEDAGEYTLTTKNQVEYVFDSDGVLQSISDRNGNTLSLSYTSGRLTSVTDEESSPTRSLTIAYKSGTDLIETVTGPLGREVTFSYDGNDDLEVITDVKGGETTYAYGDDGMETLEDANGTLQVTNTYDSAGRVAEQQDAVGETTCIYYGTGPTYTSGNCGGPTPAPASDETIVVDQRGFKTTYINDTEGRTSGVKNHLGDSITHGFDANNNVDCITDELGRKTAFDYDANGNLTQMIDAANTDGNCQLKSGGVASEYTYNSTNDLTRVLAAVSNGVAMNATEYIYDDAGNLTRLLRGGYRLVADDQDLDAYDDSEEAYLSTDEEAACAANFTYSDEGPPDAFPLDFTDDRIVNNSDTLSFGPYFNQTFVPNDDPLDPAQRYDLYQDANNIIDMSDVLSLTPEFNRFCSEPLLTCFTYGGSGLLEEVFESETHEVPADPTDACLGDGNTTLFEYDSNGNLVSSVNPRFSSQGTPPETVYDYDDGGRLLGITNELGHDVTFTYDDFNMPLTRTDELGNVTSWTYDNKGTLKAVTDGNRQPVSTPESGTDCGASGTGDGDDDDSDGVADDGCPNSIYDYDDADRLVEVIDALGQSTTYGHDAGGNLTSVTDANRQPVGPAETGTAQCGTAGTGNGVDDDSDGKKDDGCPSTIYVYDSLNRLTSATDALGRVTSYTYDAASQLAQRTDARGLVTKYFPDALGRLDLLEHWNITLVDSVDYTYDAVGNRTYMDYGTGNTAYFYDHLNRLVQVTGGVRYIYDELGDLTELYYLPSGDVVEYAYNEDHSLDTVTDWLSNETTYTYDDAGNLTKTTLPNGVWTDFGYDTADRLTSVFNEKKPPPVTISSFSYTLDAAGNRTQMVDTSGTNAYDYDPLYRLTEVTYPDPETDTYTYDPVGNRLTKDSTSYTYDAANQMLTAGAVSYGYDANGNQTTRGSDTFTYDHENRLLESIIGSFTSTSAYNGDGLRVSLEVGDGVNPPVTTDYVWDVNRPLPVVLDDGTNRYVYGLDLIAAIDGSDEATYFTYDGLGSTTELLDEAGDATDAYTYDVFGAVRASTGSSANDWLFTGEQHDTDSDLYYLRARHYDPATGRFLGQDPLGIGNGYSYVGNNPVNYVDPSGLCHQELGYDRICNLVRHIKEGGFRPPSSPTATATPSTSVLHCTSPCKDKPSLSSNQAWLCPGPRPAGESITCTAVTVGSGSVFGCCRDPFELLTGRGINHHLRCWAAEFKVITGVLLDFTLETTVGKKNPIYYQLPSHGETTKNMNEVRKVCN